MNDERFDYPYDPERHGPRYGHRACASFAAQFLLENRNEFSVWLHGLGIDSAEAVAWAERTEALRIAAARGLQDWPGGLTDPLRPRSTTPARTPVSDPSTPTKEPTCPRFSECRS